jgi:hypothetical protein
MEQSPLTLRVIPENLASVLFDGDDRASQPVLWDLSVHEMAPHPCEFTPSADLPQGTAPLAPRQKRRTRHLDGYGHEAHVRTPRIRSEGAVVSHSADRLAKAIVMATRCPSDPRTLAAWGQQVGVSRGALRVWCKAAGVSARSCLDFLRLLRAVVLADTQAWDLLSILDVVDQRSLLKLLDRGGVCELCREKPPTVGEFLIIQHFLEDRRVLQARTHRLHADRG